MDGLNIIERANKIITFRKYIREECRKKGLDYPSDEKIAEYIRNQLQEDITYDQLSFKEFIDPFTGSKNPKA